MNLAINARDAMPQGGTLMIETANARLDEDYVTIEPDAVAGEYVVVIVSDSGVGMAPEVLRRAFDPFFTTKDPGKGTGLGLSMVYGFIKQSGGHVKIYSEPGHGTTVRLYLPRHLGPAAQPQPLKFDSELPDGHGRSVLLVEDDPEVQRVAVAMLSELNYLVFAAASAEEALALLECHADIRLLFSDIMLQGDVSGVDLAHRAREVRPELRVLLTSGFSEQAVGQQTGLESDFAFISKPYRRDQLAHLLGTLWERPSAGIAAG